MANVVIVDFGPDVLWIEMTDGTIYVDKTYYATVEAFNKLDSA